MPPVGNPRGLIDSFAEQNPLPYTISHPEKPLFPRISKKREVVKGNWREKVEQNDDVDEFMITKSAVKPDQRSVSVPPKVCDLRED